MCAIVDANAANDVFGEGRTEAARGFFEWLAIGDGILVVGGKLLRELEGTKCREWLPQAERAGRLVRADDNDVDRQTRYLQDNESCKSRNDHHVIALARVSGARLLYTNDAALQQDFKNRMLVNPRGKIYATGVNDKFDKSKRALLRNNDCAAP